MSRSALLTALALAIPTTFAQTPLATSGFTYIGCVSAPASSFGLIIDFFAPFTPAQCQAACAGKAAFAALGGGCQCGLSTPADYKIVDEKLCNVPCQEGNPSAGFCGGDSEGDMILYNLYGKVGKDVHTTTVMSDCEEAEAKTKLPIMPTPSTTFKTVFACPDDVTDCPLEAETAAPATTAPPPPPAPPAPVYTKIAKLPCPPENCMPACPPEGCPPCPPEGCPPVCATDCPVAPNSLIVAANTTMPIATPAPPPSPASPVAPVTPAGVPTNAPVPAPPTTTSAVPVASVDKLQACGGWVVAAAMVVALWVL